MAVAAYQPLMTVPMLSATARHVLDTLLQTARSCRYVEGQILFDRGEAAQTLYVLTEGRVGLFEADSFVYPLFPSEIFDLLALISGRAYLLQAKATTAVATLEIPASIFLDCLRRNSDFAFSVLTVLAERSRQLAQESMSLSSALENLMQSYGTAVARWPLRGMC